MRLKCPLVFPVTSLLLLVTLAVRSFAQDSSPAPRVPQDASLAEAVKQLQQQVNELRSIVSELRSESDRYRLETNSLREELRSTEARIQQSNLSTEAAVGQVPAGGPETVTKPAAGASDTASRIAKLEEEFDLLTGEVNDHYQTKVESASKYRLRVSGMVLMNLFTNRGMPQNADLPGVVDGPDAFGRSNSTGFSLRQSQIGLRVFGPELAGARTSGDVQVDFAGGFPYQPNGVVFGIARLRTGTIHLDWDHTSLVAGQDAPFFSALSPTSFATVAEPAFAYSGNLWTWIPQIHVEHRFTATENSTFTVQGGILDGLTGEAPASIYTRTPQAGEFTRQPGYAARVAWSHNVFDQGMTLGAGGYYSRQDWGLGRKVDGWASTVDWTVPLAKWLGLSGEFYRGRALGGLGGGLYHSAVFDGYPSDPASHIRGLDTIGGWTQLKFRASSKLEFNAAVGQDNPFASQVREYPYSTYRSGLLSTAFTRNQSELLNFIYRPRSNLIFSTEYRHVGTYDITNSRYTADTVNLAMGILF